MSVSGNLVALVDESYPVVLNGEEYTSTIRTVKCEMLVNGVKCESCKDYRSTLRAICHRHNAIRVVKYVSCQLSISKKIEQRERMSHLRSQQERNQQAEVHNCQRSLRKELGGYVPCISSTSS